MIEFIKEEKKEEVTDVTDTTEKPVANPIDLLLESDLTKFKVESKQIEIPRLSEVIGQPFVVELKLLNATLTERIDDMAYKMSFDEDGNPDIDFNTDLSEIMTLVEATYTLEGKQLFKSSALMKKFGAKSHNQLCKKLLTPGERKKIYQRYREMAGFVKTSVKDIKN